MLVGAAFVTRPKCAHAFTDEVRSWNIKILVDGCWLRFQRNEGFDGYIGGMLTCKTNSTG